MRPKKVRWIRCNTNERCFRPKCKKISELDGVVLTLDEFEAMRLSYIEELKQDEVAKKMGIHRFEVAIAASTMLFGLSSGASLATVVGVLIEVPVMLMLVKICLRTEGWFQTVRLPISQTIQT